MRTAGSNHRPGYKTAAGSGRPRPHESRCDDDEKTPGGTAFPEMSAPISRPGEEGDQRRRGTTPTTTLPHQQPSSAAIESEVGREAEAEPPDSTLLSPLPPEGSLLSSRLRCLGRPRQREGGTNEEASRADDSAVFEGRPTSSRAVARGNHPGAVPVQGAGARTRGGGRSPERDGDGSGSSSTPLVSAVLVDEPDDDAQQQPPMLVTATPAPPPLRCIRTRNGLLIIAVMGVVALVATVVVLVAVRTPTEEGGMPPTLTPTLTPTSISPIEQSSAVPTPGPTRAPQIDNSPTATPTPTTLPPSGSTSGHVLDCNAEGLYPHAKITSAINGVYGFGWAVAVYNDTFAVGAPWDDEERNGGENKTDVGSVFLFRLVEEDDNRLVVPEAVLRASDGASGDEFGQSLALRDGTLIVGAPGNYEMPKAGKGYVFVRAGGEAWVEKALLAAPDRSGGEHYFGSSSSISFDGTIAIGAPYDDDTGEDGGGVYVFVREDDDAYALQQKIVAHDGAAGANFGFSVSVHGDTLVVGAFNDNSVNGEGSGSAYVYIRKDGTWNLQQKLVADDGVAWDHFGWSVALQNERMVVSARYDGAGSGSVYVYIRRDGLWVPEETLFASDGAEWDVFGSSVSLWGDTIIVGAWKEGAFESRSGSAYIFTRHEGEWAFKTKLVAPDRALGDYFGKEVEVWDNLVVVGAIDDDDNDGESGGGSVHVFDVFEWC